MTFHRNTGVISRASVFAALCGTIAACCLVVPRHAFSGTTERAVEFRTPDNNIRCVDTYGEIFSSDSGFDCTIRKTGNCRLGFRAGWYDEDGNLNFGEKPFHHCLRPSDTDVARDFKRKARVLPYGKRYRLDALVCTSRRAGLTCRTSTGHGFFLSRTKTRVF